MTYKIKTSGLNFVESEMRKNIAKLRKGELDVTVANSINNSAGKIISAHSADLRLRLATPKLAEIEAG